jgi:hypothetical protein
MKRVVVVFPFFSAAALACLLTASPALAQDASRQQRKLQVTDADNAAAAEATEVFQHTLFARTDAGAAAKRTEQASLAAHLAARANGSAPSSNNSPGQGAEGNDQLRFPGTLTNFFGGPTLPDAQSHPIFLASPDGTTCPANTCWGDPDEFLENFGHSNLSHVTDQYVRQHADNRYTLGDEFIAPFTPSKTPLLDADIRALVHAAALLSGESGPAHIFHVFLPPGQDECHTAAHTSCYAPDGQPGLTFAFCAFHSAVAFKDVGVVLFTVEPFQNVLGCNVRPGTVNGQTVDSTNSTLSHETMETITDPLGDAWFNVTSNDTIGEEIGDECQLLAIIPRGNQLLVFGDPTEFRVGKHRFATQPEWSNQDHGCAIAP